MRSKRFIGWSLVLASVLVILMLYKSEILSFISEPWDQGTTGIGLILILDLLAIAAAAMVYFLPTIIALSRGHHNRGSILVINLFLGWTFIGWVVALAMACGNVHKAEPAIVVK